MGGGGGRGGDALISSYRGRKLGLTRGFAEMWDAIVEKLREGSDKRDGTRELRSLKQFKSSAVRKSVMRCKQRCSKPANMKTDYHSSMSLWPGNER